jgi:ABC-type transport system involved in multi-copper enzyme maturation permease subunit
MIFGNLIKKEIRHLRAIIITESVLYAAIAITIVATFHFIGEVIGKLPEEFFEILAKFNIARDIMALFEDYSIYIWSQWNGKNLFQIAAVFVVIMAAVQFAGEVGKKTIGFYLSRPITRIQGYMAKITTGVLINFLVAFTGTLILVLASLIAGYQANWVKIAGAFILTVIWTTFYYLFACIISIRSSEIIAAGLLSALAGIILSVPGLFAASRQFSLFYQIRATYYFTTGDAFLQSLVAGLVLCCFAVLAGRKIFDKRDY